MISMRTTSIVEITPANRAPYYIVTCAGHGEICRTFDNPLGAIAYRRELTGARP